MISYYYSDELTSDTEGNLVKLCASCAAQHPAVVQFADALEDGATQRCELCGSSDAYPLALTPQRAQIEQHYRATRPPATALLPTSYLLSDKTGAWRRGR